MKKLHLALFVALGLSITAQSQSVSPSQASTVGFNFLREKAALTGTKSSFSPAAVQTVNYDGNAAYYVVNMQPEGFVLVSASNKYNPVIGFSFEGTYNPKDISPAQETWMETISMNILERERKSSSSAYQAQWNKYSSAQFTVPQGLGAAKQVLPLNNIKWNQNYPYNYYCPPHPDGPGGRCYAGCVATTMGMIMKHWGYPETGTGSKTYFWGNYYTVYFDSTQYAWDDMGNTINANSIDAIATLLFHAGISVNMHYTPTGSGANSYYASTALKNNFSYIPTLELYDRIYFTDYNWKFTLKEELDRGRPIYYAGNNANYAGHAFVLDGYIDTLYWHFNWGWSGSGNGYYNLNDTDPNTMDYYLNQDAIMGIMPPMADFCDDIEYTQDHWTFDDGSAFSYYQNNRSCQYLIEPEDGGPVQLNFVYFDTEASQDVLYIYDGPDATYPLIGSYSGNQMPGTITSSGSSLFMRFETNGSVQKQGWKAAYQSLYVGMEEPIEASTLNVFPNPATDQVKVEFFSNNSKDVQISIYDLSGREVYSELYNSTAGTNVLTLPVDELGRGMYIVTLKGDGISSSKKLAIQ